MKRFGTIVMASLALLAGSATQGQSGTSAVLVDGKAIVGANGDWPVPWPHL